MKLRRYPLLLAALLTVACAHLPEIRPAPPAATQKGTSDCTAIFPRGAWQMTHAIEIIPPAGASQTLLGVIRMSSVTRTFHCVLMTIEGLVLLEADYDGQIKLLRAISPLDKPGVAQGMVQDILLIFFAPEQPCTAAGYAAEGGWICRYPGADQGYEDIWLQSDGTWQIRRYSSNHKLLRTVAPMTKADIGPGGLPSRVELIAHGLAGYRLRMKLVEAIELPR